MKSKCFHASKICCDHKNYQYVHFFDAKQPQDDRHSPIRPPPIKGLHRPEPFFPGDVFTNSYLSDVFLWAFFVSDKSK